MTAVTASTPPADASAPTKRHHRHRERGVLSLAAIGAVSLLWLGLDAPGVRLVMPRTTRDKMEAPVIAHVAVQRGVEARPPLALDLLTATEAPTSRAHDKDHRRASTGAAVIVVPAAPTPTAPAPKPVPAPTAQPLQISPLSPAAATPPSSPPAAPSPPATAPSPVPVELPPAVSQVVTTAVSTVTAAVPSTSDVTAATQQATSTLPAVPTLHP